MSRALSELLEVLEHLAPLRLAASWDNVGLLIEGLRSISSVLVCVDLTEAVLAEALAGGADLIVAYHPPLFRGVSRLGSASASDRVLLGVIRSGVHLYSPHTALDAAAGGMTDWLIQAAGPVQSLSPIAPDRADPSIGAGRSALLSDPAPIDRLVPRIKAHLGLKAVRVASPPDRRILRSIAACPGAGGSVLEGVRTDLLLTGEMRHHDVVAHVASGRTVVLADHTPTERGYLPAFARRMEEALPGLAVRCSVVDAEPLSVV